MNTGPSPEKQHNPNEEKLNSQVAHIKILFSTQQGLFFQTQVVTETNTPRYNIRYCHVSFSLCCCCVCVLIDPESDNKDLIN